MKKKQIQQTVRKAIRKKQRKCFFSHSWRKYKDFRYCTRCGAMENL